MVVEWGLGVRESAGLEAKQISDSQWEFRQRLSALSESKVNL